MQKKLQEFPISSNYPCLISEMLDSFPHLRYFTIFFYKNEMRMSLYLQVECYMKYKLSHFFMISALNYYYGHETSAAV